MSPHRFGLQAHYRSWIALITLTGTFVYVIWFGMNSDLNHIHPLITQLLPAGHCACQTSTTFSCSSCFDCQKSAVELPQAPPDWVFHFGRDDGNVGLSESQCNASFPGLFEDVYRATDFWQQQGGVLTEDLDAMTIRNGMARAMIYEGELYILATYAGLEDHRRKILAVLSSMYRALVSFSGRKNIPNIEFVFSIEDKADDVVPFGCPLWSLARKATENSLWLIPDFGNWAWDSPHPSNNKGFHYTPGIDNNIGTYTQVVENIINHEERDEAWIKKEMKLVWRGKPSFAPKLRRALIEVARDKPWSDIMEINWKEKKNFISMEDHCKYMFIAHVEGRSYSAALKYRQACRSVVIIHKLQYIQHHHYLLLSDGPSQNFLEVERDFSDLPAKIEALIADTDAAERIANNSVTTFRERYLTQAAEACYWRALWKGWALVSPSANIWVGEGHHERKGLRYESFLLLPNEAMRSFNHVT